MKKKLIFILTIIVIFAVGLFLSFATFKIDAGYDKFYHFIAYFAATITISAVCYYVFAIKSWFNYFLITVCILGGLLGAVIEKLQEYCCVSRESDLGDWLANITGISVAVVIVFLFKVYDDRRKERNEELDEL